LHQAVFGASNPVLFVVLAQCPIPRITIGIFIAAAMIEMYADGGVTDMPGVDASVAESNAKLAILAAVSHAFVEAVDGHHIPKPSGAVGALEVAASGSEPVQPVCQGGVGRQL
tara:strand:+ start:2562 stop:2900 length:339 start_codon:yes stop_codon:yes gene_type:complete